MGKRVVAAAIAFVLVLGAVWVCWFGGFQIFGTLSELDDDGIHAFLALNFIDADSLGDRSASAQIVRNWLREFEERPYVCFVYGVDNPAEKVLSAALRYYYGLGPVTEYPPEVDAGWIGPGFGVVTDPDGVLRICAQYHPGIPGDLYFPPIDDKITFKLVTEDGSLTLSRSGTVGEAMEYTVDNQTELIWQDWDLDTDAPWEGEETFMEITMYRNGVAEYRTTVRIYRTDGLQTVIFGDDGTETVEYVSGYTGEVVETVKLTLE